MDDFYVQATPTSPEIDFRFSSNTLGIRGESYPENAAAFYSDAIRQLRLYLATLGATHVEINVELKYFNSSSTKILYTLFGMLNDCVRQGNDVTLNWFHDEEDETILEFGEELYEDFGELNFRPTAVSAA